MAASWQLPLLAMALMALPLLALGLGQINQEAQAEASGEHHHLYAPASARNINYGPGGIFASSARSMGARPRHPAGKRGLGAAGYASSGRSRRRSKKAPSYGRSMASLEAAGRRKRQVVVAPPQAPCNCSEQMQMSQQLDPFNQPEPEPAAQAAAEQAGELAGELGAELEPGQVASSSAEAPPAPEPVEPLEPGQAELSMELGSAPAAANSPAEELPKAEAQVSSPEVSLSIGGGGQQQPQAADFISNGLQSLGFAVPTPVVSGTSELAKAAPVPANLPDVGNLVGGLFGGANSSPGSSSGGASGASNVTSAPVNLGVGLELPGNVSENSGNLGNVVSQVSSQAGNLALAPAREDAGPSPPSNSSGASTPKASSDPGVGDILGNVLSGSNGAVSDVVGALGKLLTNAAGSNESARAAAPLGSPAMNLDIGAALGKLQQEAEGSAPPHSGSLSVAVEPAANVSLPAPSWAAQPNASEPETSSPAPVELEGSPSSPESPAAANASEPVEPAADKASVSLAATDLNTNTNSNVNSNVNTNTNTNTNTNANANSNLITSSNANINSGASSSNAAASNAETPATPKAAGDLLTELLPSLGGGGGNGGSSSQDGGLVGELLGKLPGVSSVLGADSGSGSGAGDTNSRSGSPIEQALGAGKKLLEGTLHQHQQLHKEPQGEPDINVESVKEHKEPELKVVDEVVKPVEVLPPVREPLEEVKVPHPVIGTSTSTSLSTSSASSGLKEEQQEKLLKEVELEEEVKEVVEETVKKVRRPPPKKVAHPKRPQYPSANMGYPPKKVVTHHQPQPQYGPQKSHKGLYESPKLKELPERCQAKLFEMRRTIDEILLMVEQYSQRVLLDTKISYKTREILSRKLRKIRSYTEEARMAAHLAQLKVMNDSIRVAGVELLRIAGHPVTLRLAPTWRPFTKEVRQSYLNYKKACKGVFY